MSIHFMLSPDSQSGATIRDEFAKINAINIKVGTFDVLLDFLMEYWLLTPIDDKRWKTKLTHQALSMTESFWAKSIKIDEKSVIDELDTSLQLLLNALSVDTKVLPLIKENENRYSRYYNNLCSLHKRMDGIFPPSLEKARLWNENFNLKPLEDIFIYADASLKLEPWQIEIVTKLQSSVENEYSNIYRQVLVPDLNTKNDDMKHLQEMLFSNKSSTDYPNKNNLQWLVARDVQQEVEVVAGMIQNTKANFDEMAIIIPRDGWYKEFLIQTFNTFNIPLSRAGQVEEYADIGTQWIFDAVQAQDNFAAPMLFASLLSSPLMPYSYSKGQYLASIALDNAWRDSTGNLKINLFDKLGDDAQILLKIVIAWQEREVEQPLEEFLDELEELYSLLSNKDSIRLHKERFKTLVTDLKIYCRTFSKINFKTLLNQIQPYPLKESYGRESFLNSLHIVYEDDYMVQEVKHLFILGFNDAHYPRKLENIGAFSRMNWQLLGEELNLSLDFQEKFYEGAKATFKRQLQCAKETITFLSSALDLQGSYQTPSSSLSDIAFCFYDGNGNGEFEPTELLILLEKEKDKPFFYTTNDKTEIKEHRELISNNLSFSQNIFELRKNSDGTLRPESPSSFEKIMISPLGWFFYRQGLESKIWDIEELTVAIQGTIAHGVFEDIFCPNNPTYDLCDINIHIERRIKEEAPFLSQEHRRLDYEQLKTSILKSADEFKELLLHCDADVKSTEEQLTGEIFGIPIAGRTDAILNIGGKQLVLDYKKSGSSSRIKRMKSGFDHQLFLYRVMLNDEKALTAYYTMNDATLVVDEDIALESGSNFNILGIEEDCTVNASSLIIERINELVNGDIKLNCIDDNSLWDKRGITASYSLESSPIINLFIKSECKEA